MSFKFRELKDDGADIGFVTTCVFANVVSFEEFKSWLDFVLEHAEDVPSYIFDLMELDEKHQFTLGVKRIVGFQPYWDASEDELLALDALCQLRGRQNDKSDSVSSDALARNPHLIDRFKEVFPFIEFEN